MTPVQKKVYDHIKSHIAEHGYSPTYRQMVDHFGYSLSNINRIVHLLKEQGLIDVSPGRARSIQLVEDGRDKLIMRMYKIMQSIDEGEFGEEFDSVLRDVNAHMRSKGK